MFTGCGPGYNIRWWWWSGTPPWIISWPTICKQNSKRNF